VGEPLHFITVDVDVQALVRRARTRGLPMRELDAGYLVHSWLEATFGPGKVRPFSIDPDVRSAARVYGYSDAPLEVLRQNAVSYADPTDWAAAVWDTAASKPMPEVMPAGIRLGFEARVVPTRRREEVVGNTKRTVELDAFLSAARRDPDGPPPDRATVYDAWLGEQLGRDGGAHLEGPCSMQSFQLAPLLRRSQGEARKSRMVTLPDVRLRGVLRVGDPVAFQALLRRGVGRHRAFGFGMLLLRRPVG
jgi:CRISPR system Cascade subunit CasE